MTFDQLERELLDQISTEHLQETTRRIAGWVRLSGSRDERSAFEYVKGLLDEYGLTATWLEHPALVSYPLAASLRVIDGDAKEYEFNCLGHAFSASVDRLEAEVVDLGAGRPADFAAKDVRGKIVLTDGLATPVAVFRAEQAGSLGQIFVNDDHLHNMIVSTVWGTPTPQSAERLPKVPVVSIVSADGRALRGLKTRPVRARMTTHVFTDVQSTPIVIGELKGRASQDFVLFSGHMDSWDFGAMDNASANATMLEVARVLALHQKELDRGLRVAFWSGHSHGRYSGSTWYADNYWEELYDRCVAHVNIDSTGARGATYYGSFPAHFELGDLGVQVIEEHTGVRPRPYRMTRAGDMSFNGIGIPSLFMELSQVPVVEAEDGHISMDLGESTGGEMPWWWHTTEDTIDKIDLGVLRKDTQIYLSAIWRLCHPPLLPMDFRPVLADIAVEISGLRRAAGTHLDLTQVEMRVSALAERVDELAEKAAKAKDFDEIARLNQQIKMLSRILIPVTYTSAGRFEHDPAWVVPFLPGLADARRLNELAPDSDEYLFLRTQLLRSRNEFSFALRQALEVLSPTGG